VTPGYEPIPVSIVIGGQTVAEITLDDLLTLADCYLFLTYDGLTSDLAARDALWQKLHALRVPE
jgi:hypothetical protein